MNNNKIIVLLASTIFSASAMAGGFDGPFVQVGIGGSSTGTKVSNTAVGTASVDGTQTQTSFNGLLAVGYSKSFGEFNIAGNVFYVAGNQNAGNKTSNGVNSDGESNTETYNSKLKNTFGISIEPGWNFSNSTLGYLKLAWVMSQANTNFTYTNNVGGFTTSPSASKNINGFGYGLGLKQMITKNAYAGIDLMAVNYQSYSVTDSVLGSFNNKPTQYMGFVTVGYKF